MIRSPKDFGNEIRRIRKKQDLSQKQLADKAGLWQETISKIENGAGGTKLETIFDLCAALGLEMELNPRSKGTEVDFEDIF